MSRTTGGTRRRLNPTDVLIGRVASCWYASAEGVASDLVRFDWYLFIGSLFLLVFIITRWVDEPFMNGLGLAFGLSSILMLGVGITTGLRRKRDERA